MLSCDEDGDSTCEQIIGEWETIDTQVTIIGECDGYEDYFDSGYEDFDNESQNTPDIITKNLVITSEFICENNHLTHCSDESDILDGFDLCYTSTFTVDGDIMTLHYENITVLSGSTTINGEEVNFIECFGDVTQIYERVE